MLTLHYLSDLGLGSGYRCKSDMSPSFLIGGSLKTTTADPLKLILLWVVQLYLALIPPINPTNYDD